METTMNNEENGVDLWIDAIPENPYDPCPCGCGKKFRFALLEGIAQHEEQFYKNLEQRKSK